MSFLFGKKNRQGHHNTALPPVSREAPSSAANPSIPTANGPSKSSPNEKRSVAGGAKSPPPGPPLGSSFGSGVHKELGIHATGPDRGVDTRGQDGTGGGQEKDVQPFAPPPPRFGHSHNGSSPPDPRNIVYPWSQRSLKFISNQPNPFPRYGAAVNAVSNKEGEVYLMGGLVDGSVVKGDLWMIEAGAGNLPCYPITPTYEGPGPRVGHASLLVGNAFIVFGGDTKMDDRDRLDDTLYLLNTCESSLASLVGRLLILSATRHWSRSLPPSGRPAGRYGHTLNILGSKIYVFGGQVEGYFFNDLIAFDLNTLQIPSCTWEKLISNTSDGSSEGQVPPARTNHTIVSWNDKLYLFGGTNGTHWFNDVWSYDPVPSAWVQLECIGYIPAPREGHSAALVNDVMYIFGGRTEEGADLGDLAAFRLTSRRWYTFQNMGPSPSPRSGHSMTAFGNQIIVLAGEPSSAPQDADELSLVYILDTSKIRYPNDQQPQQISPGERLGNGRPSIDRGPISQFKGTITREALAAPGDDMERRPSGSHDIMTLDSARPDLAARYAGRPPDTSAGIGGPGPAPGSRLPRVSIAQTPSGMPPQQALPPRLNGNAPPVSGSRRIVSKEGRGFEPPGEVKRAPSANKDAPGPMHPQNGNEGPRQSPLPRAPPPDLRGQYTASQPLNQRPLSPAGNPGIDARLNEDSISRSREAPRPPFVNERQDLPKPNTPHPQPFPEPHKGTEKSTARPVINQDPQTLHNTFASQRGALLKELEAERLRNAWYESELALARKAGFQASKTKDVQVMTAPNDEDASLIEALITLRARLAEVQAFVDSRVSLAAQEVTEIEQQRDVAVNEAVYAKAKLAAHTDIDASMPLSERAASDDTRTVEIGRKLAAALATQANLQSAINSMTTELQAERRAREAAEGTAEVAQKHAAEIDNLWKPGEIESLRMDLHKLGKAVRDEAAQKAEVHAAKQMLMLEKDNLSHRLDEAIETNKQHDNIFLSLREAVGVSEGKASLLERRLEDEKNMREAAEQRLQQLRAEHDAKVAELETMGRKLLSVEEIADSHANEARTHRQVVLAGLDKINTSNSGERSDQITDERVSILKQQVEDAHGLAQKAQGEADAALEKLRKAEERIAGLEAYQVQSTRESLSSRKQLQDEVRASRELQAQFDAAQQQLVSHQRDASALSVQHNALKELLDERGSSGVGRPRGSPSNASERREPVSTPKDLEQMRASFEMREQDAEKVFREKIEQLERDYQAAVHYVKTAEFMVKQMKDELTKSNEINRRLQRELKQSRSIENDAAAEWEQERKSLHKEVGEMQQSVKESVSQLERQMKEVQLELYTTQESRDRFRHLHEQAQQQLTHDSQRPTAELDQLKSENAVLQLRAIEAEKKVTLLLDQVNTSIGNYRRQSQQKHGSNLQLRNVPSGGTGVDFPSASETGAHSRDNSLTITNSFSSPSPSHNNPLGTTNTRNSTALDSLATELETLRTHWEGNNRDHNFERDARSPLTPDTSHAGDGISSSLANWRKRLDEEEIQAADANAAAARGAKNGERNLEKEDEDLYFPGAKREKDRSENVGERAQRGGGLNTNLNAGSGEKGGGRGQ